MPNWMYSEVHIHGPNNEIGRFRAAHICKDNEGEDTLSFDSIIPMPPELRESHPGRGYTDALVWALGGAFHAEKNLLRKLGMCSADDTPLSLSWLQERKSPHEKS